MPLMSNSQSPLLLGATLPCSSRGASSPNSSDMLHFQEAFFGDFLKQHKEFTNGLLTHNKILYKSLNRLFSILEGKNAVTETDPVDSTDVTTDPDFHYNGINLMSTPREKNASTFGRKLGRVLFGDKDECDLINAMMSPGKDQENARPKCCDDKKTIFAKVAKKKYPKSPEAAYAAAREAANQMGREFRGKYLSRITGAAKGSSPN